MTLWWAAVLEGTPRPLEDHDELRWVPLAAPFDVDWLPADLPIVRAARAAAADGSVR